MAKIVNQPRSSAEVPANENGKSKNLIRVTSDNLCNIFNSRLKKGNVVIIDGLKYRFSGDDMFFIDKNAKKSADLQGKKYKEIIELPKYYTVTKVILGDSRKPDQVLLRADNGEKITIAYRGVDYSKFKVGQKVPEWVERDRMLCTVTEVILGDGQMPDQVLLRADNGMELFIAYENVDYSKFKVGQKVLYIKQSMFGIPKCGSRTVCRNLDGEKIFTSK